MCGFGARGAVERRKCGCGGGSGGRTVRETRVVWAWGEGGGGAGTGRPCWTPFIVVVKLELVRGEEREGEGRTDRAEGAESLMPFLVGFGCLTVDMKRI